MNENQTDFRKQYRTSDHILTLKPISEKLLKNVHISLLILKTLLIQFGEMLYLRNLNIWANAVKYLKSWKICTLR